MPPMSTHSHISMASPGTKLASRKALFRRTIHARPSPRPTSTGTPTPAKHTTLTAHEYETATQRGGSLQQTKDYGYGTLEQPEYYEVDIDPKSATPPYDFPRKSGAQLRYGCINPLPCMNREPVDGPAGFAARGRK